MKYWTLGDKKYLNFFGLENFKVFKERKKIELEAITILIGANSSGKSSLNKGILVFLESIKNGKLEFGKLENSLQLGGEKNTISWDSRSEDISFIIPFEISNFPKFGDETFIECEVIINKKRITNYKFSYKDDLLIEYNKKEIKVNRHFLFKHLEFPEYFKIQKLDDSYKGKTKDEFGIVSLNEQDYFQDYDKNGEFVNFALPHKLIFSSSDINVLNELKYFYETKIDYEESKKLELYKDINIGNGETQIAHHNCSKYPISEFFLDLITSDNLLHFWDEQIFDNCFSNKNIYQIGRKFDDYFKYLFANVKFLKGIKDRPNRIYQYGEESELNKILQEITNNNHVSSTKFIEKWCSKNGFGLNGQLNLTDNSKNAYRSINIGLASIADEGQGIYQLISLILNVCYSHGKIFLIEEPEVYLHPSYQSKLADFFIDAQKIFRHQFIIETHSEYLIRKLQYLIAKKDFKAEDAVIYNFRKATEDNAEIVKRIDIEEDGSLSSNFYPGFYDEALNWELELLKLKRGTANLN